jgi:hypothetical protein
MISRAVHKLGPSLPTLAAAIVFSRGLLLTDKSSIIVELSSSDVKMKLLSVSAGKVTSILTDQGYNHYGINE